MGVTILTMSRGDEPRLEEWVRYHSALGVTRFHVILDAPVDDSEGLLKSLSEVAEIVIDIRERHGDYLSDGDRAGRWGRVLAWREEHAERIAASPYPINDEISDRQYAYFPEILADLAMADPEGWVSLIDVDEFMVLPGFGSVQALISAFPDADRIRLRNFNVDMTEYEGHGPVLTRFTRRWSRAGVEAYGRGWERRVKSLVRTSHSLPIKSVHSISAGPYVTSPRTSGRIHHYRFPTQDLIPYDTVDETAASEWRRLVEGKRKGQRGAAAAARRFLSRLRFHLIRPRTDR